MADRPLGFGIVGVGMIARFHARAIAEMSDARLLACVGRRPDATGAFAAETGCAGVTDMAAFLATPGLDVVTICTPSGAHLEPALQAIGAGKHVIVEKPLEVTTARIDHMVDAANAAGVTLAGVFPRRFNPATARLKQAVADGRFGRIASADAYVKWHRPQAYYEGAAWRGTWALDGGGALMNQAIHTVDLLLHVMGDVASVRADTRLVAHQGIEVEDAATALVAFRSGAMGVIQATTAAWSKAGHPAEVHVMGEAGSVILTDDRFRVWEFQDESLADDTIRREYGLGAPVAGAGAADPAAIDFQWHQRNFEDVAIAIRQGRKPLVDGREARRAVALIRAIYDSAARGGAKIEVEDAPCT